MCVVALRPILAAFLNDAAYEGITTLSRAFCGRNQTALAHEGHQEVIEQGGLAWYGQE
jgi:hypothetical protein